ncbi:MAG: monovalent cation/H(+) antiporter subunit G [Oligoflexus sp.]
MKELTMYVAVSLLTLGTIFVTLAAVGILRMPDLYSRMQTATKASTFGSICCMIGVAIFFRDLDVVFRVIGIGAFLFLTAPIAAHVLCRAGVTSRVPMSDEHVINELAEVFPQHKSKKYRGDF